MSFTLFVQSNSPGEISAWLHPVSIAFAKACPEGKIVVFLTPCQYASGNEAHQAKTFPNVTKVYSPRDTLQFLTSRPIKRPHRAPGAVLYLGGDPLYSRLLGLKLHLPVYGYTEKPVKRWRGFKRLFTKTQDGDLMAAQIAQFLETPTHAVATDILLFTGSRPQHTYHLLPFMAELAAKLKHLAPALEIKLSISPFISTAWLAQHHPYLPKDTWIQAEDSLALIANTQLLVTIPGTSTAQAAYLHTPTLMLLPLNEPKAFIFDGLVGLLAKTPVLGTALISIVVAYLKTQKRFYALPNLATHQKVISELIGVLDPQTVAEEILSTHFPHPNRDQVRHIMAQHFQPSTHTAELIIRQILEG